MLPDGDTLHSRGGASLGGCRSETGIRGRVGGSGQPHTPMTMFLSAENVPLKQAGHRKAHPCGWALRGYCRRSPNLPHTYACSTIGPARLNFRVRDGNGCDPRSMVTGKLRRLGGSSASCRDPECFARRISTPWNLRDLPDVSQRNRLGSNLLGAGLLLLLRPILQGLC